MRVTRRVAARAAFEEHALDALAGNVRQLVLVDETDAAEARLAPRHERALLDPAAEVSGLGVAHDLARVNDRLQIAGDDFVERCSFRSGDFDDTVSRPRARHIGSDGSNVVRRARGNSPGHWSPPPRRSPKRSGGSRLIPASRLGPSGLPTPGLDRTEKEGAGVPIFWIWWDLGSHLLPRRQQSQPTANHTINQALGQVTPQPVLKGL